MTGVILWTPAERLLLSFHIFLAIFGGIKYALNAKNIEKDEEKKLLMGFAMYTVLLGIGYIFYFIGAFFYPGEYIDGYFIGTPNDNFSPAHEWIFVGHIFSTSALLIFIIQFERIFPQTRFILSFLSAICVIITLIAFNSTPINWDMFFFSGVIILIIFSITLIRLVQNASNVFQSLALFLIIGFSLSLNSTLLDQPSFRELGFFPIELTRVIQIISMVFIILPAFIDIEKIKTTNPNKLYFTFFLINVFGYVMSIISISIIGLVTVLGLLFNIVGTIVIVLQYKKRKTSIHNISDQESNQQDILHAFSRPKKITEEEVSISKEKKICLVCKGKDSRKIYLCPDCNALYCLKCCDALTTMENACWVCESPFDESKPVKPYKKEEKEVLVEEKNINKKGKKKHDNKL